jgi:hypothetical protein
MRDATVDVVDLVCDEVAHLALDTRVIVISDDDSEESTVVSEDPRESSHNEQAEMDDDPFKYLFTGQVMPEFDKFPVYQLNVISYYYGNIVVTIECRRLHRVEDTKRETSEIWWHC